MAVKVLINNLGQHLIAEVKQVENTDTKEVVAYWVENPRLVSYHLVEDEDGSSNVNIRLTEPCVITTETAYSIRADSIVSILDPKPEILQGWQVNVFPPDGPAVGDLETKEVEPVSAPTEVLEEDVAVGLTD